MNLDVLRESFLISIKWEFPGDLKVMAETSESETWSIILKGISYLKVLESFAKDKSENEIWTCEVVDSSRVLASITVRQGVPWMTQQFGLKYERSQPVPDPTSLRHVVLLSDYIDLEVVCTECILQRT
jgi:hypothetical protein